MSLHPSGNAYLQVETPGPVVLDLQRDVAIPRVLCLLTQLYLLAADLHRGTVGQEQVDIEVAVLHGIDISRQ